MGDRQPRAHRSSFLCDLPRGGRRLSGQRRRGSFPRSPCRTFRNHPALPDRPGGGRGLRAQASAGPQALNRQPHGVTPISAIISHAAKRGRAERPAFERPEQPRGRVRWLTYAEADRLDRRLLAPSRAAGDLPVLHRSPCRRGARARLARRGSQASARGLPRHQERRATRDLSSRARLLRPRENSNIARGRYSCIPPAAPTAAPASRG